MSNVLDQLRDLSTVVADTGDAEMLRKYKPIDCTTNPSIVFATIKDPASAALVSREITDGRKKGMGPDEIATLMTVAVGAELSKLVPGRVSTEVDPRLSFDTDASVAQARWIVADYAARGIPKDRILIKLAATWEGIQAANILQQDGIDCNLTLVFSRTQAIACADTGAFLISPFVGRITDWFKKAEGVENYAPADDPGVRSVKNIFAYYKAHDIKTIVMGASFRNTMQIKALAGCDRLTLSPKLLEDLAQETEDLIPALGPEGATVETVKRITEANFRWAMNDDPMACQLLADGIRNFGADNTALVELISSKGDE